MDHRTTQSPLKETAGSHFLISSAAVHLPSTQLLALVLIKLFYYAGNPLETIPPPRRAPVEVFSEFQGCIWAPPVNLQGSIVALSIVTWRHRIFSKTWTTTQNEVKLILEGSFCSHKAKRYRKSLEPSPESVYTAQVWLTNPWQQ